MLGYVYFNINIKTQIKQNFERKTKIIKISENISNIIIVFGLHHQDEKNPQ